MSGLSREQNYEVKYLRKVLLEVDERIELPETLRADSLRHKLDNITPAPQPVTAAKLLKPKRFFTWQSGLTYAAAFLLIVGLFYGLGFNKPNEGVERDLVTEQPMEDNGIDAHAEIVAYDDTQENITTGGSDEDIPAAPAVSGDTHEPAAEPQDEPGGYGGPELSERFGSMNNAILTYRVNDAGDPFKEGYPISLEVLSNYDDRMLAQVDLILESVQYHNVSADTLTLVGETGTGVAIYVLDMTDMENPVRSMLIEQQGAFHDAREKDGMIHVVSRTVQVDQLQCATETLPDAANQQVAHVITALNLQTLQTAQKAFIGEGDLRLRENSFITYAGTQQSSYEAMILLDGLDMSVGSVA